MGIRLDKAWQSLDGDAAKRLPGQLGVYQIADAEGAVLFVGYAGGRSLFGLRGEVQREATKRRAGAAQFRVEVTTAYLTRFTELLGLHLADHGVLPRDNENFRPLKLSRLSPA